ncbi:hypothetical protein K2Z83_03705 [Oscillochloris sp. ZM17-4]|uniref:hypothetical protein n=1 Tax=Oscillochloris sp. ZM17-4 TaxID=2866714 RepID=UPI001C736BDF|nr:hypothetical protein [Oscillochloris sp. ZM17-4]MBX0326786.1 hypothetical protein [Oscillochloris sp. ZM17-4]
MIRVIAAAAMAIALAAMTRRAPARSSRRSAFGFSAAAFAMFALSNGLASAGAGAQLVQVSSMLGVALIGVSLLMMVRSYTGGEMGEKLRRAREMVAEERARTKERR